VKGYQVESQLERRTHAANVLPEKRFGGRLYKYRLDREEYSTTMQRKRGEAAAGFSVGTTFQQRQRGTNGVQYEKIPKASSWKKPCRGMEDDTVRWVKDAVRQCSRSSPMQVRGGIMIIASGWSEAVGEVGRWMERVSS